MEKPKIIKDKSVFGDHHIPSHLRVRAREATILARKIYSDFAEGRAGSVIAIFGSPGRSTGIGKTTLARYVGTRLLPEYSKARGIKYAYAYVNVFSSPSLHDILSVIASQVSPKITVRGSSNREALKAIVDYVYRKGYYLLVVIDEFQNLIQSKKIDEAHIYSLLRIYEEVPPPDGIPRISYLLVASDYLALSKLRTLMPQVESQISFRIHLQPYRKDELYEILEQRAEEGLYPGTWRPEHIEMIAEHYGAERGDGNARRAINTLLTAAEYAEFEGVDSITEEHVRYALSLDYMANISEADLENLGTHELILLLALARYTSHHGGYVNTGKLRRLYNEMAEFYDEKPRGHTQFNTYINTLASLGLIDARPSGKGMRGRTTLLRLPPEIPARPLAETIENILSRRLRGRGVKWI